MRHLRKKSFTGLVRYGQARHSMLSKMAARIGRLNASGLFSHLEAMGMRSNMQRRFRRKSAA